MSPTRDRRPRWKGLLLGLALLGLAPVGAGCGDLGASDETCRAGEPCVCDSLGSCRRTCEGRGCDFRCEGAGSCLLFCEEGGCRAEGTGTGSLILRCPGGSCDLTCSGLGSCELADCPENCNLHCLGSGTCTNG